MPRAVSVSQAAHNPLGLFSDRDALNLTSALAYRRACTVLVRGLSVHLTPGRRRLMLTADRHALPADVPASGRDLLPVLQHAVALGYQVRRVHPENRLRTELYLELRLPQASPLRAGGWTNHRDATITPRPTPRRHTRPARVPVARPHRLDLSTEECDVLAALIECADDTSSVFSDRDIPRREVSALLARIERLTVRVATQRAHQLSLNLTATALVTGRADR